MYVVTGITGQVGSATARSLLHAGRSVRAVVRSASKGTGWAQRGCEVALADLSDPAALTAAFHGAEAVFVLLPPCFDPAPGFPEVRGFVAALRTALVAARPERVVCLSTIGAQAERPNLLSQLTVLEQGLGELPLPITFLRPAWFLENAAWDVAPVRASGVFRSFLQPLDKPVPMVATADVGRTAAALLQEVPSSQQSGRRIVELEGPRRVTPLEIAACFARLLGRPVRAEAVSREMWEELFRAQGLADPLPRMQMLDGFNQGWIEFTRGAAGSVRGEIDLETVLKGLVASADHDQAAG